MAVSTQALSIAGVLVGISAVISIYQIICHLRYYREPVYQRYIVRIIFMVPLYGIASLFSLIFSKEHIYFDTIRDLYEAWILYNFLSLCLAYVGGPGEVVVQTEQSGKAILPSCVWCTCCLPQMPVNGVFIRRCKQGVLQFVLIKPLLAALTIILYNVDAYTEGDWSPAGGYLWIQLTYNVCYTLALYGLVLFYQGTEELLAPYRPLLKFVLVKSVIFLTFWQGLCLSVLASWGVIDSPEDAKDLQNFLICIEMLGAAILLLFAFPHKEYKGTDGPMPLKPGNVRHAISIRDVVSDTVHQFAPQYHDYVLYSDDTSGKPVKKTVKTRTFVKMGEEMTRYQDGANLLAHVEMRRIGPVEEEGVVSSGARSVVASETPMQPVERPAETKEGEASVSIQPRPGTDGGSEEPKLWVHIDLGEGK
ncbi:hypothetical protein BSKO_00828 [Bryopsis sp. KO-2023]|nr:hypothetical protein BSKO_00828 [Bryopsis sp. KO-2023]